MSIDILHDDTEGGLENPHQAGNKNYTPNGHTQTLVIFYRAHSKLFHTYFTKRISHLFTNCLLQEK